MVTVDPKAGPKYIYRFTEGNAQMRELLGGKGANLAEMTNMGLHVPPGFTVTTEACMAYLASGAWPEGLGEEVEEHLRDLETEMAKRLGDADDPLLVSVRSGAKFSMPGMMDTVLNLGLNDESVHGLARQSGGDLRFALDSYRRFVQMFGKIVMEVPGEEFESKLEEHKKRRGGGAQDTDLDANDLAGVLRDFRVIYKEHVGAEFPQEPRDQLRLAIEAVFKSWNGKRARDYRRQNKIADDLGTAVNVVAMVFGNRGMDSGTGVAFTRDPATGERAAYGDYLPNAQGEDVVAGIRNTLRLQELADLDPKSYSELREAMDTLERHYRDMCDIEFTIEKGKLWILQTRVGKRTAFAEWVMAYDMLEERLISEDEALLRVDANRLEQLFKPGIKIDPTSRSFSANGTTVGHGEFVTIDGFDGAVYVGKLELEESKLERARRGDESARQEKIWKAFERSMGHADSARRLRVRANADTPDQARNARERGAEGIGLCRTEHMFLVEERVAAVRQMIFASTHEEEEEAYAQLLPLQRDDFVGIFRAMDGLPVTVRLLDPPLHEFLPDLTSLAVAVALGKERGEDVADQERVLAKVRELHDANPMLGLRGVRLGIVKSGLS